LLDDLFHVREVLQRHQGGLLSDDLRGAISDERVLLEGFDAGSYVQMLLRQVSSGVRVLLLEYLEALYGLLHGDALLVARVLLGEDAGRRLLHNGLLLAHKGGGCRSL
jgi:hypothetical protein